jgi:hypothetical protein
VDFGPEVPNGVELLLEMKMGVDGLGAKVNHVMVPEAAVLECARQWWKENGDVMGVVWVEERWRNTGSVSTH